MLWPSSTPDHVNLPSLDSKKIANYLKDENEIIDLVLYDAFYMLIVLTRKAIYVYRLKPLCPVVVYVRSEQSIKGFGENVEVVVRPDGKYLAISTSRSHVLIFEVGDFGLGGSTVDDDNSSIYSFNSGPAEVCRFVRADHFVNDGLSGLTELKQVTSVDSGEGTSSPVDRRTSEGNNTLLTPSKSRKGSVASSVGGGGYNSYSRRQSFSESLIQTFPGPGEAIGVRELKMRLVGVIKEIRDDSEGEQITSIIPLEDYLMISTSKTTKFFKWSSSDKSSCICTINHSELEWLDKNDEIVDIYRSKAMSLFSITTKSGSVYSATLNEIKSADKKQTMVLKGYILHDGKRLPSGLFSSINARFSEISVACLNGTIYLYNIRDYSGTSKLLNVLESPSLTSSGNLLSLNWSSDGCALLAGYQNGWILYSVYGMINASSFLVKNDQKEKEPWLGGIKQACWSFSGDSVFILSKQNQLWQQYFLKWGAIGNWTHDSIQRPILLKESNKLLIYRGQEQPDLTTIDRDALLWLTVTIPGNYIAENWPIKFISSSPDGRYIAIAGVRGLTHYSLYSGKWKLFNEEYMDREISVRAGMIWYKHYLIVAVDTDQYKYEIKIYSRELELSSYYVVISEEMPTPVLKMSILQDLLVIYGHDNNLYFYRLTSINGNDIRSLDFEYKVSLNGMVHSPARVRSLSGLISNDTIPTGNNLNLVLLVDGMLMVLYPTNGGANHNTFYKKYLLHHNIEYYYITPSTTGHSMLWAFDGKDMLVWIQDLNVYEYCSIEPSVIPVESYPLAVLMDKGILTGIETDTLSSRENHFSYFKFWTSTQLFVPFILESILKMGDYEKAVVIANEYKHLKYFSHILEMLLYQILVIDEQVDNENDVNENSLLVKATDLVVQFPQMLDIFLGCTRKIEIKYWSKLFKVIGTPQELFERCILLGKLKTAGGYLLILHSLSKGNDYDGKDNTIELFKLAYESGDWDLCKELTRFLTGIDPSLKLLKEIVGSIGALKD